MTTSIDDPFAQSLAAYKAKDFIKAAGYCRALLMVEPEHAACLHLLGVLEQGFGKKEEAERLVRQSLALRPGFPEMHFSFAQILSSNGKHAEAVTHYEKTLALKPDHVGARLAIVKALNSLGVKLCEEGRFVESAETFERALLLKPDSPEILNNLGVICHERGVFHDAIRYCEQALALQPDYAAALNNLGNNRKALFEWNEAIACYRHALTLDPNLTQARNNLGLVLLYGTFDREASADCFKHILKAYPDHVTAMTHLGIIYCLEGNFAEGIRLYQKALSVRPDYRDALNNLGNALRATGQLEESIKAYEKTVSFKPEDPEGQINLGMAYLMVGRFKEGWQKYEWRFKTDQLKNADRHFSKPQWHGEEARGKTLLIHAEQGFGDTLQFCRYVPLVAAKGIKILLEVQPELVRLMQSLKGASQIIAKGHALPDFDLHCPMMSLPLAMGAEVSTIPSDIPYLMPDAKAVSFWKQRLQADGQGQKIGLVWTGNPRLFSLDLAAANQRRSIPLDMLAPLAEITDARFYNLQKHAHDLPSKPHLIDYMHECHDFAETAALIANLDLVLSVDTSVAHLTGSIGKPIWLLNRYDTCWRWLERRKDSPWYPTLRLFSQSEPGNWQSVIEAVTSALI